MIYKLSDKNYFKYEVYDLTKHSKLLYDKILFENIRSWMKITFGIEFTYHLRCVESKIIASFLHHDDAALFELTWG